MSEPKAHKQIAERLVTGWALNDANDPHSREALIGRIVAAFLEVAREQREKSAALCDDVARGYSGGTFNDSKREVRAAEECAEKVRNQKESE